MTVKEFYFTVGGDYEDAVSRLQSDMLIARFLRMLPNDNSMAALGAALEAGDAAAAFRAVHTLKGVSLNLSLTALANACAAMTEALRGTDTLPEYTGALYDAVEREYSRVLRAMTQLD